jgi:hypothetical protein
MILPHLANLDRMEFSERTPSQRPLAKRLSNIGNLKAPLRWGTGDLNLSES